VTLSTVSFGTDVHLKYDGESVVTFFPSGHTGGGVVDDDAMHAAALGMTPIEHRLHHELAHHFVGIAVFDGGFSPVLWKAAHRDGDEPPVDVVRSDYDASAAEEWFVTALQYHSRGCSTEYGALVDIQGFDVDVAALSNIFRAVFDTARMCDVAISIEPDALRKATRRR
jgi:hypothetical protein